MGVPFAERFVSFASERKSIPVNKITKIESNPDQSKHLETARTTLFDIELDFVNLRSEEYASDSRIPTQVTFGTPLQDALRRDLTINTLFYNVHTRQVEDHTEKGLADLRQGIVRTPLPPLETFRDDELRVIRCIRFASRLGFEMVTELQDAARDAEVQAGLAKKISRERVGEELDKMLKGPNPLLSLQLIYNLALYSCIFYAAPAINGSASSSRGPTSSAVLAASLLHDLISPESSRSRKHLPSLHPSLLTALQLDVALKARLFLAASLYPYRGITYLDSKKKTQSMIEGVIREGLKLGTKNHYLDGIPALYKAADLFAHFNLEDALYNTPSQRVAIGLLLRDKNVHNVHSGSHWSSSLLFALVTQLVSLSDDAATQLVNGFNHFIQRVQELGLDKAVDALPLVNGREVLAVMNAEPGPWTKTVLDRVVEWQLEYPNGSKDECIKWLAEERDAGRLAVGDPQGAGMGSKRGKNNAGKGSPKKAKR